WTQIIAKLKLAALARQLADNSAFLKSENQQVTLSLAPGLAHLATPKAQERLESALSKQLGYELSLIFEQGAGNVDNHQTLASERAEEASIKQQQATESIHNDPAVDAMKKAFDARVIESSIKSID
ncbi:MAG: DNA polymerase III subunit gamma/tau, partial [Gammaproteobacteria bacterium]